MERSLNLGRTLVCLTVEVTNRCPLRCAHCASGGGEGEDLAADALRVNVQEAASLGCQVLNISGGEPFVLADELCALVRAGKSAGLLVRITTSGYWATSVDAARRRLKTLADAGLRQVFLSASDHHQAVLPVDNLLHAARAAWSLSLDVYVYVVGTRASRIQTRTIRGEFAKAGLPIPFMTDSNLIPFGRAEELSLADELRYQSLEDLDLPCPSYVSDVSVRATRRLTPCAAVFGGECEPLNMGPWPDTTVGEALARANSDALGKWLTEGGVVAMKRCVESRVGPRFGSRYVNLCHLCGTILADPEALDVLRSVSPAAL